MEELISEPAILADMKRFTHLNKEYKSLSVIMEKYYEYKNIRANIDNAKDILKNEKDSDMRDMAKGELDELDPLIQPLEEEIRILLIPKEPEDEKNATIEIRGGTGGDEASLFAGELYRMYSRYCENKGWKTEV